MKVNLKKLRTYWPAALIFLAVSITGNILLSQFYTGHQLKLIGLSNDMNSRQERSFYADIDLDGNSEEFIYFTLSDNKQPALNQYAANGSFQNLWYLNGDLLLQAELIIGDYNGDSLLEIYAFTRQDSFLYLNGIKPYSSNQFVFEKVPVCPIPEFIESDDLHINGTLADVNNDAYGEVIFTISGPNPNKLQQVICYNILQNKLIQSDNFPFQLVGKPLVQDISGDKYPEIFLSTKNLAHQQYKNDESTLYSGTLVLNAKLDPLFDPLLFRSRSSLSSCIPLIRNTDSRILCINTHLKTNKEGQILLLDTDGTIVNKALNTNKQFIENAYKQPAGKPLLYSADGKLYQLSANLKTPLWLNLRKAIHQISYLDLNSDNNPELVVVLSNELAIIDTKSKRVAQTSIPGLGAEQLSFTVKENKGSLNHLAMQSKTKAYRVMYSNNNPLIYLIILFSLAFLLAYSYLFLRKFFHKEKPLKKHSDQEVMQLQIELMKNQLDPHFLFNALNSISFSINTSDRKNAYYNLGVFSKLMRQSIGEMEEFYRNLEDEINFVKYYLHLEKFRFKEQFNYHFLISPQVTLSAVVPKMSLFCYVEAALKKGVLPKTQGGTIEITIDANENEDLVLSVKDDGNHRNIEQYKSTLSNSMMAMQLIIDYYNQHNNEKISLIFKDLGSNDDPKGTKVSMIIPFGFQF